jgi:hypothetical protein
LCRFRFEVAERACGNRAGSFKSAARSKGGFLVGADASGICQPGRGTTKTAMTQEEEGELRAELLRLQQEHRDLDAAIAALQASPGADIIQVQRLKKRKLQLRDRITFIGDQLTPDIIA